MVSKMIVIGVEMGRGGRGYVRIWKGIASV